MSRKRHNPKPMKARARHHKAGTPPGILVAHPEARTASLSSICYNADAIEEYAPAEVGKLGVQQGSVLWVNMDGLGDVEMLQGLGDAFHLHPLALEDVLNIGQRQKVDEYADHLFVVIRMPRPESRLASEQVSLFLGQGYLLSFQEHSGDCFDAVRNRLREGRQRIRSSGADYLAYAIIDAIIDSYFTILESISEHLLHLEDVLVERKDVDVSELYQLRRDITSVRNLVRPLVDLTSHLVRAETPVISEPTQLFLRDCYDHAQRLLEAANEHRETAAGLIELHRANVTDRTNDVMRLLTVIATIFIPMTFVAGIYGMNFDPGASKWNMPELAWPFGYPLAVGVMVVIAVGMLVYFHRKGWLR